MDNWKLAEELNYTPLSTFWDDFTYAEYSNKSIEEIRQLAAELFDEWKEDHKFLTELIMVINHKSWYWDSKGDDGMTKFYSDLYYEFDDKAITYLESTGNEEALTYYFKTLD